MTDLPDWTTAIDILSQAIGIELLPVWAATQGIDKEIQAIGSNVAPAGSINASYTVPAGKNFYITDISYRSYATLFASADLPQICQLQINVGTVRVDMGGNGGGAISLAKPIKVAAGITVYAYVINCSNHNCNFFSSFSPINMSVSPAFIIIYPVYPIK